MMLKNRSTDLRMVFREFTQDQKSGNWMRIQMVALGACQATSFFQQLRGNMQNSDIVEYCGRRQRYQSLLRKRRTPYGQKECDQGNANGMVVNIRTLVTGHRQLERQGRHQRYFTKGVQDAVSYFYIATQA